ncbi:MAG: KAP family P-loop NTPase fold protein [Tannerellaceae bacterium]
MKDKELEIPKGNALMHCRLNRKEQADTLTAIIDVYSNGFVLSVDGKWGTGKSTFMKMWKQDLTDRGYKTILFNAWENDFTSEPLTAIMGEIKETFFSDTEKVNSITNKLASISKGLIPTLAKTAATLTGLGQIAEVVEKVSAAFAEEVESYATKKTTLLELRSELSNFIKDKCQNKPLVFIVDELDRCRPDYAVEVLEKIKHLFAVDGIIFVLSIDKHQLCQAIKGYYGSEGIDSPEYLRRFIDLEYTLPEPDYASYCNYAFEKYELSKFFHNETRQKYDFGDEIYKLTSNSSIISASQNLSLRQIDKLFAQTRIAIRLCPLDNYAHSELIFILIYIKTFHSPLYQKIKKENLSIQELVTELEHIYKEAIKAESKEHKNRSITFSLIQLIICYYKSTSYSHKISDLYFEQKGNKTLAFNISVFDLENVISAFNFFNQNIEIRNITIAHYIKKIDLLDSFQN